ncbi:MAG: peptidase S41 [Chloracidobacterium sp.]|nr:peptidase S41 [Chloracidobacterium sp.]
MKRLFVSAVLVVFCACTFVFGQASAAGQMISSADLKSDLAILRRAYEQLHPGLYRYNTKAQMDASFADLERQFSRDMSLREAYVKISVFLAKVKCGHTYTNFYNQPKSIVEALFKGKNRVPFYFRWLDGQMIVTRSFDADTNIKPGTEIVSINGTQAKEILEKLMTIARADGSNDAKRVSYLEVGGNDRWEAFDIYFPMFFPPKALQMELVMRPIGSSKTVKALVMPLTDEERKAARLSDPEDPKNDKPAFTLERPDSSTAILRMPTWALYNSKWDWKKFVDETFDRLIDEKVANLVIDIRANEGGQDVGDAVISRIADHEIVLSKTRRLVRYQKVPTDLIPYLETWDRSFDDWGKSASEKAGDFYILRRYDDDERGSVIKPSGRRYMGRVFVLVGAVNSSATFQFAQTVKLNKLATLVGQPTGGNQRGINGGAFYFLNLPKSKIEVDLPLIGQFPIIEAPDTGIEPDIHVRPTATDIAAGRDTELATVKSMTQK